MKTTANVYLLPTEKKPKNTEINTIVVNNSMFWISEIEEERYDEGWYFLKNTSKSCAITIPNIIDYTAQYLYITIPQSDLEISKIKEDDWYLNNKILFKADSIFDDGNNPEFNKRNEKIIATTNFSLSLPAISFKDWDGKSRNLPSIPQSFIEYYITEYNKDNVTKQVEIELVRDENLLTYAKLEINSTYGNNNTSKTKEMLDELYKLARKYFLKLNQNNEIFITNPDNNNSDNECKFPKIVQELFDEKANENNIIDLNAYSLGLLDCYNKLEDLYRKAFLAGQKFTATEGKNYGQTIDLDDWLKENLK